jgi:general secretion pathway protein A
MYEAFYGFREKPFSILPDPGFLYFSPKHTMALDLLEYGLTNQAGFNVITGGVGTGKTTLIRYLLHQLNGEVTVGLINNTQRSFGELLQWILLAFGLDVRSRDKVQMYQSLLEFLAQHRRQGRRALLIVDEAQNMAPEALEELRMLSNVNADRHQVLQLVLVGQAQLRETLRRPDLEPFAQRVAIDYHLEPLDFNETEAYIRHRIQCAGAKDLDLFAGEACSAVFHHTMGTPRLINLLCDAALVYGYAEVKRQIDARTVHEAAWDKKQGGIFPAQPKRDWRHFDNR